MSTAFLDARILHLLDEQAAPTAAEIAWELDADIDEVHRELRRLIVTERVTRIHAAPGVLRYRAKAPSKRTRYHDCVKYVQPEYALPEPAPARPVKLHQLLSGIDAVAGERDVLERLSLLEILGAHVGAHLHNAMTEAELDRARNQQEKP